MMRLTLIVAASLSATSCEPTAPNYDLLIRNGLVYDGSLQAGRVSDIGIVGDRIVALDVADDADATRVIDASGKLLMPGFIDPHTHATNSLPESEADAKLNYLTQGVTTVFIGNDGDGIENRVKALEVIEKKGTGTNVAFLAGHGQIRESVMNLEDRAPTADEMATMKALLADDMQAGAFGLSTGLYYSPGSYSETDEVIELAKVAAEYGGIYETHMRSEGAYGDGLLAAVEESIRIGREASIPVHISHIKALGQPVWGQGADIIRLVEAAREEGIKVSANQYPWRASGTRFSNALIPRWAAADSKEKMNERLANSETGRRIRDEMLVNLGFRGGPDAMLVTAADSIWRGQTLTEIATALETDPIEAALQVVLGGDPSIASFVMNGNDMEALAVQPWVMTGSDGSSGHPRLYGTYPKGWDDLVRGEKMSIAAFVHRSSGLVAETFGLCDRGFIRKDYVADIAIIDADHFKSNATYESPTEYSDGVEYLLINGAIVIDNNNYNANLPGKLLRRHDCND